VLELPTVNRNVQTGGTGITGDECALLLLQVLHHFGIEGLCTQFYPDPQRPWSESNDFRKLGYKAIDITLRTAIPLEDITQCTLPAITEEALEVTLAGDAEDTIYYTTDGSFPGSANKPGADSAGAVEYAAPFTVASGTTVRWAAYRSGRRGSDIGSATIS
jgi:hypothetical protein